MFRVTFHGAVRTVTGSMHLVDAGDTRMLLDCGLYQGRRADSRKVNSHFPFPPAGVDAVLLSHAHLDHCGNLPTLVRQGFKGDIYCTPATRDLAGLILRDSAKVQREDARALNARREATAHPPVDPLYSIEDAEEAIRHLVAMPYRRKFSVGPASVTFLDAGHILGSAVTVVEALGKTLAFTGDLGRAGAPILRDPEPLPAVDVLLSDSTYGDRRHESLEEGVRNFAGIVRATVGRGGKVLVPAFAMGRTQDLAYMLHRLREDGQVPPVAAFVDSPMAVDATEIFRAHPECFDEEIRGHLERHDPFGFKQLRYVRSVEESRALNEMDDPFIVIATSGMCEFGRILHHLVHHVGDPKSALVFVGFQAAHTLGRRLADGISPVHILDGTFEVRLSVHVLDSFSAHADQQELTRWIQRAKKVGRVFCVHGEERPSQALADHLTAHGFDAQVPTSGQEVAV